MIKAKTATIISKEMSEKRIDDAIERKEVLANIEKLIVNYAENGYNFCYYRISSSLMTSWSEIVLRKIKPLLDELESAGYKVILSQRANNDGKSTVYVGLYWGDSYSEYKDMIKDKEYGGDDGLLYCTINNLLTF